MAVGWEANRTGLERLADFRTEAKSQKPTKDSEVTRARKRPQSGDFVMAKQIQA
jgi:hypothetical protein